MKTEQEANATRAVNPCVLCVLCGGKGFARNGEIKMPFNKVVQSHRRLRHIAPGSLFGKIIGAGRNSRENATHPLAPRGIATELDRCQTGVSCGLAAAHLRCRRSGGVERCERHRVSRTAGTRPGNRYYGFLPEIQPGCLFPPGQPPGPAENSESSPRRHGRI
jgi:hypothetical protein